MKKFGIVLGSVLILYILAAVAANLLLPQRLADAEDRNFGVRVAIAKIAKDRQDAEDRIGAVRSRAQEKGVSRITETAMILDDADLNRLARVYLGVEWSERESAFLDEVVRSRGRLFLRKKRDDDARKAEEKKAHELELRKKMLSHRLHSPYGDPQRDSRKAEVERQLAELCDVRGRFPIGGRGDSAEEHSVAWTQNEDRLLKLAKQHEAESIGELLKRMAQELERLGLLEKELACLRRIASVFCVGSPAVTESARTPKDSGHEERL